jgi:hypothetical protein
MLPNSEISFRKAVTNCASAYVSARQRTSAYVSIRQHTSAYVSIRQHTSEIWEKAVELAMTRCTGTYAHVRCTGIYAVIR